MKKKIITFVLVVLLITNVAQAATYRILVNTKKCRVTIYEKVAKDKWRELNTVKCCVGSNGKTPKGNFTIGKKEFSFSHDDKEYRYVSYFSGKCAFHTVPYVNGKYDKSSLGHKRSNGCIRLTEDAAKWIYKYCKRGTKVIIK